MSTTPPPPRPLQQMTNDRGVCEQTTVPGCAQTTLAALAKRQFGGLKRHLCHTLELGGRKFQKQGQNLCHQGRNIEVRGAILGPPGAEFFDYVSPGRRVEF